MDTQQFQLDSSMAKTLTSWKKEPDVQTLKRDLETVRSSQQAQVAKIQRWNDLMQVNGHARPDKIKGRSSVQPKLIRRQAEWRYSALTEPFLGSNKLFKVSPATWSDTAAACQNELVLNWQFRTKLNKVKLIDDYVRSIVDEGTCIVRVGWKRVTVPIKTDAPVYSHYPIQNEQDAQQLQQAIAAKGENPRDYESQADPAIKAAVTLYEEQGTPTVAQQTGTQSVTTDKVLENRPTVEILNPANVFIDMSCLGDMDKALFTIVSFETNKADLLKEGKRYHNLDVVNWEGNAPISQVDHVTTTPTDFQFADSIRKKVVAFEYWGFFDVEGDGTLVPIVATWIGDVMIRMEENPFPDQKLPFVVVPYLPVKRDLYGEPDAELLEDNQKILGAVTRGMIDLLGRSANGQQGFAKGMLDTLNKRKYDDGKDYEFNPNNNPTQGVIEHKYPELPQSALMMLNLQNQEAEALTGVKSFSGGMSGEAYGDVAAGMKGVMDAAAKREMAILRRLAKGMSMVADKIVAMNGVFLSEEETVPVTNEEFVQIKREDLAGNFHLETDISTAEVDNAKAQDLGFMLQTLGPSVGPEITMMILSEIADLKSMPELAHKLKNYKPPPPDPMAVQMQQLQLQTAQVQLQVSQAEVQKIQSEIQLNQAKAAEAGSKKDNMDLNYVEQETGTNHAREMQKMEAQSRGNQNLEVTKALTKPTKPGESKPNLTAAVGFNQLSRGLT